MNCSLWIGMVYCYILVIVDKRQCYTFTILMLSILIGRTLKHLVKALH